MKLKLIVFFICVLLMITIIPAYGVVNNISVIKGDYKTNPSNNGDKWVETYDFFMYDYGEKVIQTSDGEYITLGYATPFFGMDYDILLLKTNSNGKKLWSKTYGGESQEKAFSFKLTSDGGYIIVGQKESTSTGDTDILLIKTDSNGNMIWNKIFGNNEYNESGIDIIEINDNGFIVLGQKKLFGDWMNQNSIWLIKIDFNGELEWNKTISKEDKGCSGHIIQKQDDEGFIIAGTLRTLGTPHSSDIYLLKIDKEGTIVWEKTFNRNKNEYCYSFDKSSDDGFIILANTYEPDPLWYDIWLIKTDSEGELQWDKTFGGDNFDWGSSVKTTIDGGYIIAGYMDKKHGTDGFLLKTNDTGEKQWLKFYDKTRFDIINSVHQTTDGGYIITGYTDEVPLPLRTDIILIKTDSDGNSPISYNRGLLKYSLFDLFPNMFLILRMLFQRLGL